MPMPWSRTITATFSPTISAPTSTGSPLPEYLIALSIRFTRALRTWRWSHEISTSGGARRDADRNAGGVGRGLDVVDGLGDEHLDRERFPHRRFLRLDQARGRAGRRRWSRGGRTRARRVRRAVAPRPTSSVAAIVSASSASAPIGVFSSWLTFATKSRRTLSTRRASEMSRVNATAPMTSPPAFNGNVLQVHHLARRSVELDLAFGDAAVRARVASSRRAHLRR